MVSRLPAATRIVATDLNQPMLDYAAAKPPLQGRVTWQQADALALPFENASFDIVTCQFGAMFFPDKVKGYSEARRVLRPRGRFLFNVWDRISDNHFADVVTEALAALFPQDPPLFMARTPHGYHDVARIREELSAAGLQEISIETVDFISKAKSARDVAIAYCQGTPLRNEIVARDTSRLEEATNVAEAALTKRFGSGAIEGLIRAHVISASAMKPTEPRSTFRHARRGDLVRHPRIVGPDQIEEQRRLLFGREHFGITFLCAVHRPPFLRR